MLTDDYVAAGVITTTEKPPAFQSTMPQAPVDYVPCDCIQPPCDCSHPIQTLNPTTGLPTTTPTVDGALDVSAYVDKAVEWAKANKTTVAVGAGAVVLFLMFKNK